MFVLPSSVLNHSSQTLLMIGLHYKFRFLLKLVLKVVLFLKCSLSVVVHFKFILILSPDGTYPLLQTIERIQTSLKKEKL